MKHLAKMAVFFFAYCSAFAHAQSFETTVLCHREPNADCLSRTLNAFQTIGCSPTPGSSPRCRNAETDPLIDPQEARTARGKDLCTTESVCQEPSYSGRFGTASCKPEEQVVDLSTVDSGITLTTRIGFRNRYVTILCK